MKSRVLVAATTAIALLAALAGCATAGGKMDPKAGVARTVTAWKNALVAKDVDGIMKNFSEHFENSEWGDKEGARDFIRQAADEGQLEGIQVSLDKAETKVEGDKATVYPIDVKTKAAALTVELTLSREGHEWLITSTEVSGL